MKFISIKNMYDDIRNNSWKIRQLDVSGIIGIPRSGLMAATLLAQELHLGVCSVYEFIDNKGDDLVFYRHGNRPVEHKSTGVYLVLEDSVYNGSMIMYLNRLKELFPDKKFISCCIYLEGPCKTYRPDLWLVDISREALNSEIPVALYQYNILDNWWNFKFLYDLDGVMCLDPPCDSNIEAYENYLKNPIPLHVPMTPSTNAISICTYRLKKYEKETKDFLNKVGVNYNKIWMFDSESKETRDLTPPAQYKADIYKAHNQYVLFIESNDQEAQDICRLSRKPVYCFTSGKMYSF